MSIEERIALDLPLEYLAALLSKLVDDGVDEEDSALGDLSSNIGGDVAGLGRNLQSWLASGVEETKLRKAFGKSAEERAWFKNLTYGGVLGQTIGAALPDIQSTSLARTLGKLEAWLYE